MGKRYWNWLALPDVRHLLMLAGFPLIDGANVAAMTTGLYADCLKALAFGLIALSGAGSVAVAMQLEGSLKERIGKVTLVYGIVALGLIVEMVGLPILQYVQPQRHDSIHERHLADPLF